MMKYEPIRVISQMTSSSARPMGREPPPVLSLGFPRSAPKFLPLARAESPKRGEYITVFREAKQVLRTGIAGIVDRRARSEEHTSELQSRGHLVCRLLLEKKKQAGRMTRSALLRR